ncbi:hypothetical protein [Branchiibius cervicis]|uniref:Uncharacterized protein n=1 Tax=Branchiibius cervicis TaxID=908252 RepID=A0ABW2AP19_9MICO
MPAASFRDPEFTPWEAFTADPLVERRITSFSGAGGEAVDSVTMTLGSRDAGTLVIVRTSLLTDRFMSIWDRGAELMFQLLDYADDPPDAVGIDTMLAITQQASSAESWQGTDGFPHVDLAGSSHLFEALGFQVHLTVGSEVAVFVAGTPDALRTVTKVSPISDWSAYPPPQPWQNWTMPNP